MIITSLNKNTNFISASDEEFSAINSVLNEICNGLRISSFEEKIGASYKKAEELLNKIHHLPEQKSLKLNFSLEEILIIRNAFIEVLKEIEFPEFSTRVGASIEEAKEMTKTINSFLESSAI